MFNFFKYRAAYAVELVRNKDTGQEDIVVYQKNFNGYLGMGLLYLISGIFMFFATVGLMLYGEDNLLKLVLLILLWVSYPVFLMCHSIYEIFECNKNALKNGYASDSEIIDCPKDVISQKSWDRMILNMIKHEKSNEYGLRIVSKRDCYKISKLMAEHKENIAIARRRAEAKSDSFAKQTYDNQFDSYIKTQL